MSVMLSIYHKKQFGKEVNWGILENSNGAMKRTVCLKCLFDL